MTVTKLSPEKLIPSNKNPYHPSMYGIFAYIWWTFCMVNVGTFAVRPMDGMGYLGLHFVWSPGPLLPGKPTFSIFGSGSSNSRSFLEAFCTWVLLGLSCVEGSKRLGSVG